MDKTININLAGILFQIDEDAFRILRDYLQAINSRFGNSQEGHETIEDIESRIAEIFQSQKGLAGVITKENVENMISIIGKPEDFEQGESEPLNATNATNKRRMYRNPNDIIISGVCSGIATYLDTDPVIFRILFVLFTLFFGVGLLIYLALWIALPLARTESQKKDLYGNSYHKSLTLANNPTAAGNPGYTTSRVGNALNEVFRALGKVFYIILRIILIGFGIALVITGFLSIFCYVVIFLYPGIFSFDSSGINLVNIPAFLRYVVNPSSVPWIMILTTISFILPMLALIYWGVKMIFWFRARDMVVSLIAFVVWIMSISALAIIGFNEGVSFAQNAKVSAETVIQNKTDTLYVKSVHKVANLKYEKVISIPHDEYSVFINDDLKQLYIRPFLNVAKSDDKTTHLEITKRSSGRTEGEASQKAGELNYDYSISGDTLKIDEYFSLPSGRKWAADNVGVRLYVPTGTILKFDETSKILVHSHIYDGSEDNYESHWVESGPGIWAMTDDGLVTAFKKTKQK